MASRKKTVYEPKTVTISGTTYAAAKLTDFPLRPLDKREIAGIGGVQYQYLLEDSIAYWDLVDHLARAACDVADREGDTSYKMLAIYSDLKKITSSDPLPSPTP